MQHQQHFRKTDSLKLSISSKLNCNRKSNIYFNEEVVLKKKYIASCYTISWSTPLLTQPHASPHTSVSNNWCFSHWSSHSHTYPSYLLAALCFIMQQNQRQQGIGRLQSLAPWHFRYPPTIWKVNVGHGPPTFFFREHQGWAILDSSRFGKHGTMLRAISGQQQHTHWYPLLLQISTWAMLHSVIWFVLFS